MTDQTARETADTKDDQLRRSAAEWARRAMAIGFGDRLGLVLYLGCLVTFGLMWQLGFFINDNFTLANAVVNLADGRLTLDTIAFGPTDQRIPGTFRIDGQTYGRAYGVVAAGLVGYWVLTVIAHVADVGILLTGAWSVLLYLTLWLGGQVSGRPRAGFIAGGILAGVAFLVNAAFAVDVTTDWLPLVGLQVATMLAAGFVCVFFYRLFTRLYDERVGVAAGLTAALGTPVLFWSTVPKRHAFTAALALAAVYAFYRSRSAETATARLRFRALAYVPAGLTGWIQLADAALLVVPLAVIDVLTARENGPRELTTIAVVGLLSCLPVFVTNMAISGSPIQSPMLLQRSVETTTSQPSPGAPSPQPGPEPSLTSTALSMLQSILAPLTLFGTHLADGLAAMSDPARTVDVFVRGGYIERVSRRDGATIRLALLEAAPVVAALVAVPVQSIQWMRGPRQVRPRHATDLLVGSYVLLFAVFYMRYLPWHAAVTVRHLLPLYPALVYGVFRLRAVRSALGEWYLVAGVGIGTVVVGLELLVLLALLLELKTGEAAQLLAVGALVVAGLFGTWVLARSLRGDEEVIRDNQQSRTGAVVLGLAIGWGAMSMLAFRLFVLPYGDSVVLPVVQWILDFVPLS
jgi:hypothetical protein